MKDQNKTKAQLIAELQALRKQPDEALRESEEKYRALYDNAPLSYQSLDAEGCFIDVNPAWLKTLGYKRDEVIGKCYADLLHPDWKPHFEKNFPAFKKRGYIHNVQFKIRHKDGHYLDISFEGCIGYTPEGKFKQTYCVFQDITSRKKAEQDLRKTELRYKQLFEQAPVSLWVEDFSELVKYLELLKQSGVRDFHKYFEEHPQDLQKCAQKIKITDVNSSTLDLHRAQSKDELLGNLDQTFTKKSFESFKDEVIAIAEGQSHFKTKGQVKTLDGLPRTVTVFLHIPAAGDGSPDYAQALVALLDVSEREEAELALQESESKYRDLVEKSGIAILIDDVEGNFNYFNDRFAKLFGYSNREIQQKSIRELVHPEDVEMVMGLHNKRLAKQETPHRYEFRGVRKDGATIYLEIDVVLIEQDNKVMGTRSYIWDISDRKQAEMEALVAEMKWKATFDAMSDSVSIIDTNGHLLQCNSATLNMFGVSDQEIQEKHCWEIVHKTNEPNEQCPLERMKKSLRPEAATMRVGDRWIEESVDPVFDDAGQLISAVHVISDITERQKTAEALIASENLLNATQQLTKVGGWRWDTKTQKMYWTAETYRIHEIDPNKIEPGSSKHIEQGAACYDEKDRPKILAAFQKCASQGVSYDYEFPFTTVKGNRIWIRTTAQAEKEAGEIVAVSGNIMDITDRKRVEQELIKHRDHLEELVKERTREVDEKEKRVAQSQGAMRYLLEDVNEARKELERAVEQLTYSNKELESFAYSVSHDLRAPLRAINGFSAKLDQAYADTLGGEGRRLLKIIRNSSLKMSSLIDDLLAFSRIGRTEMTFLEFDLEQIIKAVEPELRNHFSGQEIEIEYGHLEPVYGDPRMIEQVMINLISNGIKFSSGQKVSKIKLSCKKVDGEQVYSVKDNGVGFEMKYAPKVFEVFQRLHTDSEFEGTGVGLAIVQRIIQRHGGRIWADSKPGKGATFYFSLPGKEEV